jgi:hypothetical protein
MPGLWYDLRKMKITRDGRIILSPREYTAMRKKTWEDADGDLRCAICGLGILRFDELEMDHPKGRGMNGSLRNDAEVRPTHRWCNRNRVQPQWSKPIILYHPERKGARFDVDDFVDH